MKRRPRCCRISVGESASSLTEVMAELSLRYQQTHRGMTVRTSFGGSQDLVARLEDGKSADVLVTADLPTMDEATRLTGPHRIIARQQPEPVVEPLGYLDSYRTGTGFQIDPGG